MAIPKECPNVPTDILIPQNTWDNKEEYFSQARDLAELFQEHFTLFDDVEEEIQSAGPKV